VHDGCDHAVVVFLHRVSKETRLSHQDAWLRMELVEQVHNNVHRVTGGVVNLEMVHVVNHPHPIFLRGHTQGDHILHREDLDPELIIDLDIPYCRCWRWYGRQEVVPFQVRVEISDRGDHTPVSLLHRVSETEGPIDESRLWLGVELILQEHGTANGHTICYVELEVVKHRRCWGWRWCW
jgi:hypothetical protein